MSDNMIKVQAATELQAQQIEDIVKRLSALEVLARELSSDSDRNKNLQKRYLEEIQELSSTIAKLKSGVDEFTEAKEDMEEKRDEIIRLEERFINITKQNETTAEILKQIAETQKTQVKEITDLKLGQAKNDTVSAGVKKVVWLIASVILLLMFNTWFGGDVEAAIKAIKLIVSGGK